MAHYAIGDLQGCYDELQHLLHQIAFNHGSDTLWLVGDIVNRGPKSLECLQFCMQHESSVQIVLGNHDLHLLAVMYGHGRLKRSDTLTPILNHSEHAIMRDWLRRQALMLEHPRYITVHAGLLPQWSSAEAAALAEEVEHELQSERAADYFAHMYGNTPSGWSPELTGYERLRLITNVFTRTSVLTLDNEFYYVYKGGYADIPENRRAWFDAAAPRYNDRSVIFGHWSALGYYDNGHVLGLDCCSLLGGRLTAVNLENRLISQVNSLGVFFWKKALA